MRHAGSGKPGELRPARLGIAKYGELARHGVRDKARLPRLAGPAVLVEYVARLARVPVAREKPPVRAADGDILYRLL